ncbi:NAD-dependent epimerase/dehydratase family protein [Fictibacillus phosphorivorans]|uniref:polysaccharide biosynthesis C-terminal domain-containing protein n=1 Tax=Fictibacillus phosphorivorans TaxID=1221500 RepID=UPI002040B85E|nr:NAD-dependent epimerase/dehydratase family protein [Fictibacillus phosphorivorans]MCM3719146.1 NAD-dependent epimerase/dehydratase family protein [Fictibacillus phosphorivorans]MCM3776768.1 NAD-dependent epimerase/dehydratase family protein [Fictibacillus phosphorivorans]
MKKILVTGSSGFIGKNLIERLHREPDLEIMSFTNGDGMGKLRSYLDQADIIFHLAGVNRPKNEDEFEKTNKGLTDEMVNYLKKMNKKTKIIFSSSLQAELENPYGLSKKRAEDSLIAFSKATNNELSIFRLPNVFGKWCKPNYNSVVATFCHNICNDKKITIHDPDKVLNLVYIDDVVEGLVECIYEQQAADDYYRHIHPVFQVSVGTIANKIYEFKDIRKSLLIPDLSDKFTKYLYTTYLSYLPQNQFGYDLPVHKDDRGSLFELIKSQNAGQIFVSVSKSGVKRGNHYHNTKVEKFCVIKGKAAITFRHIHSDEILEYVVSDQNIQIIDIPPGYTHALENLIDDELIVLFWANEVFDQTKPDTYYLNVDNKKINKKGDSI